MAGAGEQNHTMEDSCVKWKNTWGPQHPWCPVIYSIEMMESRIGPAAPIVIAGTEFLSVNGILGSLRVQSRNYMAAERS